MAKLEDVKGIGGFYAERLRESGVATTTELLKRGASRRGRSELATLTGINGDLILEWVNHVDLYRVKGVGQQFADLLEEAGVDTVPELAQRNAFRLYIRLREVNAARSLVRRLPTYGEVMRWVAQAKSLPRVIEY